MTREAITLHKLDCGLHYGTGTSCRKCGSGITAYDIKHQRDRALISAIEPAEDSIQERAIRQAIARAKGGV